MESRRHGHNDRVHSGVGDRLLVAGIAPPTVEAASELLGFVAIPAGIAASDLRTKPAQVAAMDASDEAATQKSDME
jgi:hypothetical protein